MKNIFSLGLIFILPAQDIQKPYFHPSGLCFMQASLTHHAEMNSSRWRVYSGVSLIVFGIFLAATTTIQSVMRFTTDDFVENEVSCALKAM